MKCASENLGVHKKISSFVTAGHYHQYGWHLFIKGVTVLFVAQAFGIDLTVVDYLTIILTATLASIGTAVFPVRGLVMLTLVLTTVGLTLEGGIDSGIDRILDMVRTVVNVFPGDLVATTVIANLKMSGYGALQCRHGANAVLLSPLKRRLRIAPKSSWLRCWL